MNSTKQAIVDTFRELLEERPLNKITVKDIAARCHVNRNTFYYYFADIPSLMEEIIEDMIDQVIRSYAKPDSPMDCLAPLAQYAAEHKRAMLHIYRSAQRETFQRGLDRIATYAITQYVDVVTKDIFPPNVKSRERGLLIKYNKCTFVGGILDWLDNGMKYDVLSDAASVCKLLSEANQAFLRCISPGTSQ